jgi:hypothetical protein
MSLDGALASRVLPPPLNSGLQTPAQRMYPDTQNPNSYTTLYFELTYDIYTQQSVCSNAITQVVPHYPSRLNTSSSKYFQELHV